MPRGRTAMRRQLGIGLVLALGVGVLAGLLAPPAHDVSAQRPTPTRRVPAGRTGSCTGAVTNTLSSQTLQVCDEAVISSKVEPVCPACPGGINVVFVQVSEAFQAEWMNREATAALQQLETYRDQPMQVGVVHYNSGGARQVLRMTDDIRSAHGPLNQPPYGHDPHGDFTGAARMALTMLDQAKSDHIRNGGSQEDEPCEFIIYFASTKNIFVEDGEDMLDAARMIHGQNVTLMVGCPENTVDYCDYTRQMPRSQSLYTEHNDSGRLRTMVRREMDELVDQAGMSAMALWQELPPGLEYVDGSASEAPTVTRLPAPNGGTRLSWEWKRLTKTEPHSVTFKVKPLAEGSWTVTGAYRLTDKENKHRELSLPDRSLDVAGLCLPTPTDPPVPTPTDTPEFPTATPLPPTATRVPPSATPTPPPTATPTPTPGPIYLPILLGERCDITTVYSDVVLVLDMSTSMNRLTPAGRSKLAATLEAARLFLDRMDFEPSASGKLDQVAVVGFNGTAWVEQPLSPDKDAIARALESLPKRQAEGTRLDLAFEMGAAALDAPNRRPDNTPVVVVLTDGLPNRVPFAPGSSQEATVLAAAQAAKLRGIHVYTIGIGEPGDIDATLLQQAASRPANFYYTPNAEDLARIYGQIAYSFGCPPGRHDWGQPWP